MQPEQQRVPLSNMRKALTITLTLTAALALGGCSSSTERPPGSVVMPKPDEQTATKPTVTSAEPTKTEPTKTEPDDGLPPEQYNSAIAHLHDSQRHSALFVCGSDDGKVTDRLIC